MFMRPVSAHKGWTATAKWSTRSANLNSNFYRISMTKFILSCAAAAKVAVATIALALVSACGGGGGSSTTAGTTSDSWPTSGSYAVVLKPAGSTTASPLQTSLSLVHASTPNIEYQIDTTAAAGTLSTTLFQGQWDAAKSQFTDLQEVAYVDDRNGAVRVTSLTANGAPPAQRTTPVEKLCSNSISALNFASPFASQLIAVIAGTDGLCDTLDDQQVRITFSDSGVPSSSVAPSGYRFLGYLRSATTGLPSQWLAVSKTSGSAVLWSLDMSSSTALESGTTANPSLSVVANLSDVVLYTQNGLLKVLRRDAGAGASISSVSAASGLSGWQSAGSDAGKVYAYLSSGAASSCAGTWRINSVSRSTASTSTLTTGFGSLISAGTFNGSVYATVCNGSAATLLKIDSTTGTQAVLKPASSTIYTITSLSGELAMTGFSSSNAVSLSFIDASGNVLFDAGSAMTWGSNYLAYDASQNIYVGDSVYVYPISVINGTGGLLKRWDITNSVMHTVGTLPSVTDLGGTSGNRVYTGAVTPGTTIGGTFTAYISSDNRLQSSGSRVYSFLPKIDNSLTLTTKQVVR